MVRLAAVDEQELFPPPNYMLSAAVLRLEPPKGVPCHSGKETTRAESSACHAMVLANLQRPVLGANSVSSDAFFFIFIGDSAPDTMDAKIKDLGDIDFF